ncbi:bifunctional UDP-4-keto-pentose/UDP-xylose synthase [Candidatus Magnetominusculus xianensis]|uniref:UDP-4-amino-4-deoxy-L-arabinose formyltransferase n=1 Tax=Candidatus Magnetominusculus xianensis TaxID=1748249 RepID=A0ABR5SDY3_9BACT|nr:bifunctional UDP-4-keto-pentose/UDP-xylose synthase [Candidatus Magnetominusculus xianensis]KWT78361.1 UDP-4-amino-4-deoxy-L-arabinose formyltransferase [Candidatus Magnetominusculus xianensis]MBF0402899.1 bifunctional UDP-4-keto-pentose/UDP-xylose synthase [Nitrospirota bacterium]
MNKEKTVFIIGIDGFIGSNLLQELLSRGGYIVKGLDFNDNRVCCFNGHKNFHFVKGDIYENLKLIEQMIQESDVVLPLAAIAQPKLYILDPINVFKLDFEANLEIIKMVVKHKKYLVFPSTSEVYGKVSSEYFNEDNTDLVVGPINQQRWIYSSIKQLLDRVIHAYGVKNGLRYCCFRPFNWIGPGLDCMRDAMEGNSRVVSSFFGRLLMKKPILIVGDGSQCRCFTDVKDGVDCLVSIIDNEVTCNGHIFNIGNPDNFMSIYNLAIKCIDIFKKHADIPHDLKKHAIYEFVSQMEYYGKGYEDITHRRPSIKKAETVLDWKPIVKLEDSLASTLSYLYSDYKQNGCSISTNAL